MEESRMRERCGWSEGDSQMMEYHDTEWGVPVHDDRKHFEFLTMEVMQCGLNWRMILKKREVLRSCFAAFDFDTISSYTAEDVSRILDTPDMLRSERKVKAVIHNAECFRRIREEYGSFDAYIWSFTEGKVFLYTSHIRGDLPPSNELSDRVSKDMKKWGFKYLGSITIYAHLQAAGLINDHVGSCFRQTELVRKTRYANIRFING